MKKEINKLVLIKDEKINSMNEILALNEDEFRTEVEAGNIEEDKTLFSKTVLLEEGYFVDIKVCTGQNNAYSDFVLFDSNGVEITCCTGDDETLDGEVVFELEDSKITILVKGA